MLDLTNEMQQLRNELNLAIELSKNRGIELARAEQGYRIALAKKILTERADKMPVTIVGDISRGTPNVAGLKFDRDTQEVLYRSANERINATKLEIRIVEGQIDAIRKGI